MNWKDIPDYAGYQASSCGQIRSIDRLAAHPNGMLSLKGRILKQTEIPVEKYLYVTFSISGKREKKYVHDLVAAVFHGPKPDGYHVDHGDRNRQNNNSTNLSYKTVLQNCGFPGISHPNSLLDDLQVNEIRRSKMSVKHLAGKYQVSTDTIHKILKRINWNHI